MALAGRQHGVMTRAQLVEAGVQAHVIDYRLSRGRLDRLHRGVYRIGPLRARYEREMAAVLASGNAAVLSHRSAGRVWGLLPRRPEEAVVEVSIQRGNRVPGPSVRVHRVSSLGPDETTVVEGIPITAPARTVLDLAGTVVARELEQALAQADRRGLASRSQVAKLVERHPQRSGTRALRALLAAEPALALTRSEAESRFLTLVRRAELEAPAVNAMVEGHEVDFLWRSARLAVEVDGRAFHSSSAAFESDRRRDAVLTAAGYRVMRVTWRQLTREPEALLVRLAGSLIRATRA